MALVPGMKADAGAAAVAAGTPLAQGRAPDTAPMVAARLRLDPSHQFVFLFSPLVWDVRGGRLLPSLREFRLEPGVAGVEELKGRFDGDATRALAELAKNGWKLVPRGPVRAFGADAPDYCLRYDGHRGPVHLDAWRRPVQIGSRVELEHDVDGFNDWLASLVEGGLIPPCPETVKRALRLRFERGMRKRLSNERNALAIANGELYEAKLAAFGPQPPRAVPPAVPPPAPPAPPAPLPPTPPPAADPPAWAMELRAMLSGLGANQQMLNERLGALEAKAAKPAPNKKPDTEKKENPDG